MIAVVLLLSALFGAALGGVVGIWWVAPVVPAPFVAIAISVGVGALAGAGVAVWWV